MTNKIILFDIDVAIQYGEREAVIIQLFQFWISKNKANNKNFYNGHYWTYNSVEAWQQLLPLYTKKQLRSTLDNLCQQGVLIRGNFNKNKFDRTCWYAFSDEKKWLSESTKNLEKRENQNDNLDLPNKENVFTQQGNSICPHGQTNTSNYTSSIPSSNTSKEIYHHDEGTAGVFSPSAIIAGWNNLASQSKRYNISALKEITPERAAAFARTMQWLGTDNIDDFFFIVKKALSTSLYLAGKKEVRERNDYWLEDKPVRGANFDFFTDLEKMRKVLEWEYADGTLLEGWYQKHPEDKDEFPKR